MTARTIVRSARDDSNRPRDRASRRRPGDRTRTRHSSARPPAASTSRRHRRPPRCDKAGERFDDQHPPAGARTIEHAPQHRVARVVRQLVQGERGKNVGPSRGSVMPRCLRCAFGLQPECTIRAGQPLRSPTGVDRRREGSAPARTPSPRQRPPRPCRSPRSMIRGTSSVAPGSAVTISRISR